MSCRSRILWIILASLITLCSLVVGSWIWAPWALHGDIPPETWSFTVLQEDGVPIKGARVDVMKPGTNLVISNILEDGLGLDRQTDANGHLMVRVRPTGYPVTVRAGWWFLGMVRVTSWEHEGFDLSFTAPGYEGVRRWFSLGATPCGETHVVLRRSSDR